MAGVYWSVLNSQKHYIRSKDGLFLKLIPLPSMDLDPNVGLELGKKERQTLHEVFNKLNFF